MLTQSAIHVSSSLSAPLLIVPSTTSLFYTENLSLRDFLYVSVTEITQYAYILTVQTLLISLDKSFMPFLTMQHIIELVLSTSHYLARNAKMSKIF